MLEYLDLEKLIRDILKREDLDKVVFKLINEYANVSVNNASELINQISNIADIIIKKKSEQLIKQKEALYWMICHHKTEKKNWNIGMLIPVCMANYPNGIAEGCENEKSFFEDFLEFLKDKKNFDFENDKKWAEGYGYWDWICTVREINNL